MKPRNDVRKSVDQRFNVRQATAAARLRVAAWVDAAVARWLARCAVNIEAAQVLFPDGKLTSWSWHAVRSVR